MTVFLLGQPGLNALKTHCVHGHPFDAQNTYRWGGKRECKTCRRAAQARWVARTSSTPDQPAEPQIGAVSRNNRPAIELVDESQFQASPVPTDARRPSEGP